MCKYGRWWPISKDPPHMEDSRTEVAFAWQLPCIFSGQLQNLKVTVVFLFCARDTFLTAILDTRLGFGLLPRASQIIPYPSVGQRAHFYWACLIFCGIVLAQEGEGIRIPWNLYTKPVLKVSKKSNAQGPQSRSGGWGWMVCPLKDMLDSLSSKGGVWTLEDNMKFHWFVYAWGALSILSFLVISSENV